MLFAMDRDKITIVKQLLRLGVFLQREGSRLLSGLGMNQQQFVVLKEIEEKGPLSQKEICSELLLEKSNVSKIIRKLESEGLIETAFSQEDSRIRLLTVTKRGKKIINQGMQMLGEWNNKWLESLSERDIKHAIDALGKLESISK